MDIKELLDEDAFDPEKLFNEKEYSTLIIKRDGFSKKENSSADLIEGLLDKERPKKKPSWPQPAGRVVSISAHIIYFLLNWPPLIISVLLWKPLP